MANTFTSVIRYYLTSSGRSPVGEFMSHQSDEIRCDYTEAIDLLKQGRVLSMPLSRNLSSLYPGLHEIRLKDRYGQIRVLYYIKQNEVIYIMHAFHKKTQEIPKREIEIVLRRLQEV